VTDTSPTARQRELGKRLRDLRKQHGLTIEDVAVELICSASKISRLETGKRRTRVRDLCIHYGVDEQPQTKLLDLARETQEQDWWTQYEDLNLDLFSGSGRMLRLSGASRCTAYRHYCKPKIMHEPSQAVSTLDQGREPSGIHCLPVSRQTYHIAHERGYSCPGQGP
jgi:transcriptional regulator with XRE-family HTH domain